MLLELQNRHESGGTGPNATTAAVKASQLIMRSMIMIIYKRIQF